MTQRRPVVRQSDVTRAIKGLLAAGVAKEHIAEVKITIDGMQVVIGDPTSEVNLPPRNEWDGVPK